MLWIDWKAGKMNELMLRELTTRSIYFSGASDQITWTSSIGGVHPVYVGNWTCLCFLKTFHLSSKSPEAEMHCWPEITLFHNWTEQASWMRGVMSSRNTSKSSCLYTLVQPLKIYHDLDVWEHDTDIFKEFSTIEPFTWITLLRSNKPFQLRLKVLP